MVAQLVDGYRIMNKRCIIDRLLQAIAAIGYGGYQANIIQFGIDQLHDASTEEIQAFISWYVWSLSSLVAEWPLSWQHLAYKRTILI